MYFDASTLTWNAESEAERVQLVKMASVLRAAAHPGIEELVGADEDGYRLQTRLINGPSLDALPPQTAAQVAGWGAALATTVADLHEVGCSPGAVTADRVVFDPYDRPVLCRFQTARWMNEQTASEMVGADLAALASLIVSHLSPDADRRMLTVLKRCSDGQMSRPVRSARQLAEFLVERMPDARIGATADRPVQIRSRRARVVAAAGAAAIVSTIAVLLVSSHGRPPPRPADRLVIAGPGAQFLVRADPTQRASVVEGRWGCGALRVAVLEASSGTVWEFFGWPTPGAPLQADLVARVPGDVRLGSSTGRKGCPLLVGFDRRGLGRAIALEPAQ